MKAQGLILKEIGSKFGFTKKQVHNFITRYNEKQRKIKAGIAIRAKGRPPKDHEITEDMKINELKYIIARNCKNYQFEIKRRPLFVVKQNDQAVCKYTSTNKQINI